MAAQDPAKITMAALMLQAASWHEAAKLFGIKTSWVRAYAFLARYRLQIHRKVTIRRLDSRLAAALGLAIFIVGAADTANGQQLSVLSATQAPTQSVQALTGQIAFSRLTTTGRDDLYVMNADGSNVRVLPNPTASDNDTPAWSPSGDQIAFGVSQNDKQQIYVMNVDGSHPHPLTDSRQQALEPDWSPDGKLIAFTVLRTSEAAIYLMNADGTNPHLLTTGANAAWSPDGKQIAFARRCGDPGCSGIYLINADGSGLHQIDKATVLVVGTPDANHPVLNTTDSQPDWSPDGKQIAFVSDRAAIPNIYIMNADGSNVHPLIQDDKERDAPAWSPNGRYIAFSTQETPPSTQIEIVDVNDLSTRQITSADDNYSPAWH